MENRKQIPYLDKSYSDKRRILREYSIKDEIRECVDTLVDDVIIYKNGKFYSPIIEHGTIYTKRISEIHDEIYKKFGFDDGISAWQMAKDFVIDGHIAIEIVWDEKKRKILNFNRLNPSSLVSSYEKGIGNIWVQYPEDPQLRRIFLDSQIIFISYSPQNEFSQISYVEGLIKPYNQLKIIEQSIIINCMKNSSIRQVFTIPTKGLSKQSAEQQIGQLIENYSENIEWDDTLGTLTINGSKHLPFSKQIWFPEGDMGTPRMEILNNHVNFDPNQYSTLDYFNFALKRASRIPSDGDDRKKYNKFVNRIRNNFEKIIIKAVTLQVHSEFPELLENNEAKIDIEFNN